MGQRASVPRPGVKLEVIGCGISRTGTASFTQALQILLGEPIYHGGTQLIHAGDAHILKIIKILSHTPIHDSEDRQAVNLGLKSLVHGYRAVLDYPIYLFAEELVELYPEAVFICTVRDVAQWRPSMDALKKATSIGRTMGGWVLRFVLLVIPGVRYWTKMVRTASQGRWRELYLQSKLQGSHSSQYEEHLEYIKRVVPKDKILYFDVREGWEPLCKILNRPVPDIPFPWVNDSHMLYKTVSNIKRRALGRWALLATGVLVVVWALRLPSYVSR